MGGYFFFLSGIYAIIQLLLLRNVMKTKISLLVVITAFLPSFPAAASVLTLNDALRATYTACVGIDDALYDLKKMAGINTAITAVGTATGVGAVAVGIKKERIDKEIDELITKLRTAEQQRNNNAEQDLSNEDKEEIVKFVSSAMGDASSSSELSQLQDKSKKLGNWRTGLLATGAATNVAGTIIAAKNKVDGDLDAQINSCKESVSNLRTAIMQARINGEDVVEAQSIESACSEFEYVDLSKINTRGKGAMVSSGVGAVAGLAGTITSAAANSNTLRSQKTDDGLRTDKEKNLNTASNLLAGASAAASATATVFNATQIKAIKQVAEVASKCTGVLK